jgi:predicted transcriptional regulator
MPATAHSIKLSDDVKSRLDVVAKQTKRSAHYLMREAVTEYVERQEKRLAFIQEAEDALTDYHETRLFVSGDAMEKWAFSSDKSKMPPWEKK